VASAPKATSTTSPQSSTGPSGDRVPAGSVPASVAGVIRSRSTISAMMVAIPAKMASAGRPDSRPSPARIAPVA
jgi:hypothetical protein